MRIVQAAVVATIGALALAGCTAGAAPEPTPTAIERFESGDDLTPIIMSSIGADPVPVAGTDERQHLAYELTLLNAERADDLGPGDGLEDPGRDRRRPQTALG